MRGRGMFVRFLEYVSIPQSLAVAGSEGATDAAMLAIQPTKSHASPLKNKTPTMAMPGRGSFLYVDN